MLTDVQIEYWKQKLADAMKDAPWIERMRQIDAERQTVQREILELMNRYLAGEIETEQLRATFDKKTRTEWDVFGLK